jgi:hypothetical protein
MNLLKKEILNHKNLLQKYKSIIPKMQLNKFEMDIKTIFDKFEEIEDEGQLTNMNKLAKAKYKSITKIYGELNDNIKTKFEEGIEIFKPEQKKIIEDLTIKLEAECANEAEPEKIQDLPGFNPTYVKQYREDYNKAANDVYQENVKKYKDYINELIEEKEKKAQMKREQKEAADKNKTENIQSADKIDKYDKDDNKEEAVDKVRPTLEPEDIKYLMEHENMTEEERESFLMSKPGFVEMLESKERERMKEYFKNVGERNNIPDEENAMMDDDTVTKVIRSEGGFSKPRVHILKEEHVEALEKQTKLAGIYIITYRHENNKLLIRRLHTSQEEYRNSPY